jgi:heme exporter protein C
MNAKLIGIGLVMAAMTVYDFSTPDASNFRAPEFARIIFWHLPCAFLTTWFLFHAAYLGFRYLASRRLEWDVRLGGAIELGSLFGLLTMLTGILFSELQWGAWWQWDPRQTSFLMVLFLFGLGLALRSGFVDDKKRAAVSSAYAVLALLPALFLMFVFPYLPQVQQVSLHPTGTIIQGGMDAAYKLGTYGTFVAMALVTAQIYSQRVRVGLFALRQEENNGLDKADRSDPAATGVVRPVGVHEEH